VSGAEEIADERRRFYIALIPLVVALPGLVLALVLWFLPHGGAIPVLFGIVVAILAFDLPACIYVLIPWLRTGKPPELSFAPLLSSPEVRRFHRHLQKRPKLNDDDFYTPISSIRPFQRSCQCNSGGCLNSSLDLTWVGSGQTTIWRV
jgi:hypothetical protein